MRILCLLLVLCSSLLLRAQTPGRLSANEIQLALEKLNVLGSVLYLAAHPDDENQVVIGYMSQTRLMRTGYLSLTRGDGGQNLIGPEIRDLLGVVRTQELLEARSVDGSYQFFTRAIDFGYSKTAEETLELWDKQKILSDVVWVIRQFRPDVIITRFPPDERAGHGHHTTSGILAAEAFDLAGDTTQFTDQLRYVQPWQPTRLVFNDFQWFTPKLDSLSAVNDSIVKMDVGVYNALLGQSVTEIAAQSRSQHQSQGFGSTGSRGTTYEYFRHIKGEMAQQDILEGIDTSWSRVPGGEAMSALITQATQAFNPAHPATILPILIQTSAALNNLPDSYWKRVKRDELDRVIQACLGLYLEVRAGTNSLTRRRSRNEQEKKPGIDEFSATPGDTITLNVEAINRSDISVVLDTVTFLPLARDTTLQLSLENNVDTIFTIKAVLPADMPYTTPYWLRQPNDGFTFQVDDPLLIGRDESLPAVAARFSLRVAGQPLTLTSPVVYKENNPRGGEQSRPFVVVPPVSVEVPQNVHVFANDESQSVTVTVSAGRSILSGQVRLSLPEGWSAKPAAQEFSLPLKGQSANFTFQVTPPAEQSVEEVTAVVELKGDDANTYQQQLVTIAYEHIPTQTLLLPATAQLVKLDIRKEGQNIGYLMGAGDEVPKALEQIGYRVTLLGENDLDNLSRFDAVMVGIRAYNTVGWLRYRNERLLQYAEDGGTLVVQYNTNSRLVTDSFAPYPLKLSRNRVTDETAKVHFLQPQHPVLNTPNKITEADFQGWVQERGLYFPEEWDEAYTPILSMNDPGEEEAQKGSLLVAPYGKGYYVYTGLSFFRELPAGVPGAYRLLTNLLSIERGDVERGE